MVGVLWRAHKFRQICRVVGAGRGKQFNKLHCAKCLLGVKTAHNLADARFRVEAKRHGCGFEVKEAETPVG